VNKARPKLKGAGWSPAARALLERWINEGQGSGRVAVFDLDNSLLCRDIGEAALVALLGSGVLRPESIPRALSPGLPVAGGVTLTPSDAASVVDYYEALVAMTEHDPTDPAPYSNGYAWAVQAMAGLTPAQVVEATRLAYAGGDASLDLGRPGAESRIAIEPGGRSYARPFFYPEMVELVGALLERDFDVWVVSASNAWTVRWMATVALRDRLERAGFERGIAPDRVVASSLLLEGPEGRLHKDGLLVRGNPGYASLDAGELSRYRLTAQVDYPLPTYSGKVAAILQWTGLSHGARPYLAAGDSPSDHAMLAFAERRLWIARAEKPAYQKVTADLLARTGREGWAIQPVLGQKAPGFLAGSAELAERAEGGPVPVAWLDSIGALGSIWDPSAEGHLD